MITHLEFPRITAHRKSDTKAILPAGYGVEYVLDPHAGLQTRYPSCTGTMQLLLLINSNGALYYAIKDNDTADKSFCHGIGSSSHAEHKITTAFDCAATNNLPCLGLP